MTTELLTDPGHAREDMRLMEQAVKRSVKNPEIPIPPAIIEAMPKVAGTILLKGEPREQLRAGALLLAFMEYNKSLNPPEQQQQRSSTINVGVNVANVSNTGRGLASQILARIGTVGVSEITSGVDAG
jgi:hypothetical protein